MPVEELREIKNDAEEATKRLESKSRQKEDFETQQFKERETSLLVDTTLLRQSLDENRSHNREEEAALRKKKFKIESEVENWIHKYDQDMEEKQTELEDISSVLSEEKAQLDELTLRYNELQKEYDVIMEARKLAAEAKKVRLYEALSSTITNAILLIAFSNKSASFKDKRTLQL